MDRAPVTPVRTPAQTSASATSSAAPSARAEATAPATAPFVVPADPAVAGWGQGGAGAVRPGPETGSGPDIFSEQPPRGTGQPASRQPWLLAFLSSCLQQATDRNRERESERERERDRKREREPLATHLTALAAGRLAASHQLSAMSRSMECLWLHNHLIRPSKQLDSKLLRVASWAHGCMT